MLLSFRSFNVTHVGESRNRKTECKVSEERT